MKIVTTQDVEPGIATERSVLYVPLLNISMVLRDRKETADLFNSHAGVRCVTHELSFTNMWENINVLLSIIATAAVVYGAFSVANVTQPWGNLVILLPAFLGCLRTCYKKSVVGVLTTDW